MTSRPFATPLLRHGSRAGVLAGLLSLWMWSQGLDAEARAAEPTTAESSYQQLCSTCHGERRYGGYAAPLIQATLNRKSDDELINAIMNGLPNTQMPAFGDSLGRDKVSELVSLLREPVAAMRWTLDDIRDSRIQIAATEPTLGPEIDRGGLILVVERGTGSVSVLDGDRLVELDRFHVGRIHGGIKFDHDFNQALAVTRDGTLVQYDLTRGGLRNRIKVGINTRNVAISANGEFSAVTNQLPQSLVIFDKELLPIAHFPLDGQPSAVYQIPGKMRFIATLRDKPKIYIVELPSLELRTIAVEEPFEDFVFVPGRPQLVASSRGGHRLLLYDYEEEKVIGSLPIEGLPHLFSASFFEHGDALHACFNHMGVPRLSIIDMDRFEVVKKIPMTGAGYFTRTHPGTPFIWVDTNSESITLIEKKSLEPLEHEITPSPGKKAMHVEFTADGHKALVSVWHPDGAVVVYDSRDLRELRRLPFAMPVGKYNAANKTRVLRSHP